MHKYLLVLSCLWLSAGRAWAQDLSISAQAQPQQVGVGESVQLVVTIEGRTNLSSEPSLPDLQDFQVYGGGRSSNFSFINGQVSSSLQFTYILVPKRSGTFSIGPVTISHAGKTYATAPIPIQVGSGGTAAPQAPATVPSQPEPAAPSAGRHKGEAVFITTSVDRQEVFVNEPLTLTFRFYSRLPVLSQPQYGPPATSGFWAEDLPPQRQYLAMIDSQEYQVIEIKTALFPTTSGKLTIGPASLAVQVEDFNRRAVDPFADSFFRSFFSAGRAVTLRSEPIDIQVKPVPLAGRPADFSGTVGKWSLSAKLDRREAKVGEAVTLEIRIFGDGNVKSVGKPQWPPFSGFKVYDTISSSEVQKSKGRVTGVKTYRTLIRPEISGKLTLPSIAYVYFDPKTRQFERISVPGLTLVVLPGENPLPASGIFPAPADSAPEVKVVAKDIRYIKISVPLAPPKKPVSGWFWILGFGFPPIILLSYWWRQKRMDQLAANPRYARRLMAGRSAHQALRQAHHARQKRDAKAFYALLSLALTGYAADLLGLSRSGVTQREILLQLAARGIQQDKLDALSQLLDECDYARFAPGQSGAGELERDEQAAEELLIHFEQVLEKERKA